MLPELESLVAIRARIPELIAHILRFLKSHAAFFGSLEQSRNRLRQIECLASHVIHFSPREAPLCSSLNAFVDLIFDALPDLLAAHIPVFQHLLDQRFPN